MNLYQFALNRQKVYAQVERFGGMFPLAEGVADEVLSLPIEPRMQNTDVSLVIAAFRTFKG